MSIIWQDPPASTRGNPNTRGRVLAFVAELKANPGQWALDPRPMTAATANQRTDRFPGTEWTVRRRSDGKYDVYGRWIGEP